jgi:hypothetical protein
VSIRHLTCVTTLLCSWTFYLLFHFTISLFVPFTFSWFVQILVTLPRLLNLQHLTVKSQTHLVSQMPQWHQLLQVIKHTYCTCTCMWYSGSIYKILVNIKYWEVMWLTVQHCFSWLEHRFDYLLWGVCELSLSESHLFPKGNSFLVTVIKLYNVEQLLRNCISIYFLV